MIITRDFVYLHVPKTGGSFVTSILLRVGEMVPEFQVQEINEEKHAGVKGIPEEHRHKPRVMNIRNPYDHLVSRYEFAWWKRKNRWDPEFLASKYPDFPELDFSQFLELIHNWENRTTLGERIRAVLINNNIGYNTRTFVPFVTDRPGRIFRRIDEIKKSEIKAIRAGNTFLRQSNLNRDLYTLLQGCDLPEEACEIALSAGKIYPKLGGGNRKAPFMEYFTPEQVKAIRKKDRLLFKIFPEFKNI